MKKAFGIFAVVAAILASTALYVGITHNSMGEFCIGGDLDNCRIDWPYVLQLWLMWFAPAFLIQAGLYYTVKKIMTLLPPRVQ